MNAPRPYWSGRTKLAIVLVSLAAFVYLLIKFKQALIPVGLGCILAFILTPAVNFIETKLHFKRWLAILILFLLLLLLVAGIIMLIIPVVVRQVNSTDIDLDELLNSAKSIFRGQIVVLGASVDLQSIYSTISGFLQGFIQPAAIGRLLGIAATFVSSLVWVVLTIVIAFYLIKDSRSLNSWVESLAPPGYKEDYIQLRKEIYIIWSSFFRGQLLLAIVVALIQTAICLLLGLRFGIFLGILAGVFEFVPSFGHTLWFILAGTTAILGGSTWLPLQNWEVLVILAGIDIVFVQIDINYLIPRIVGRRLRLPPLVVILGILAGAALANVIGVVIAAPSIATLRVIGKYIYARLFDIDPFLQDDTPPVLKGRKLGWSRRPSIKFRIKKVKEQE